MVAARVAKDQTGSDRQKRRWKSYQVWSALRDPQVRLLDDLKMSVVSTGSLC